MTQFLDPLNSLRAKRVLPMRFALPTRSEFAELANAAGLVPVALHRDYHRGRYLEDSSPVMIWILEKLGHRTIIHPTVIEEYSRTPTS